MTVPAFFFGTVFLQDELINGDGHSWRRAAIRMAIPTGVITALGLVGALRMCVHHAWRSPNAVVALVVSFVALLLIVYLTFTAA